MRQLTASQEVSRGIAAFLCSRGLNVAAATDAPVVAAAATPRIHDVTTPPPSSVGQGDTRSPSRVDRKGKRVDRGDSSECAEGESDTEEEAGVADVDDHMGSNVQDDQVGDAASSSA